MARYNLLVWSEPAAGREDEYNAWYDNTHLDDVKAIPDFVSGARFAFYGETATPRKYLAIYEIDTQAPETIMERLVTASEKMFISPALDTESIILSLVKQI